jgi:alpha-glucosidase (family GH31 glycosyl hydrolase)
LIDAYSDKEYLGLMDRFRNEDMPMSVAVLDIDWHLMKIPEEFGTAWTGYT